MILFLEFTAVPFGEARRDRGPTGDGALKSGLDECSYFVFCSMRGQPQFPHTSLIPFPQDLQVNVGSECLEFKGRGRGKGKS